MRSLALSVAAVLVMAAAASAQAVDLTARGSGYFEVYQADTLYSRHTTEREAIEAVTRALAADPSSEVYYVHNYTVDAVAVGVVVTPPPDTTTAPPPVDTLPPPPPLVGVVATLDPCMMADSAALWRTPGLREFGYDPATHVTERAGIAAPPVAAPWSPGCGSVVRHTWTVRSSEAPAGYVWMFNEGGSISTDLREVYVDTWALWPATFRWKYGKIFGLHLNASDGFGPDRARCSPGQGAEGSGSALSTYGYVYCTFAAGGRYPASDQYEERGEFPPKGWGLENGVNGHANADVPNLRDLLYDGAWHNVCMRLAIPETDTGNFAVEFWVDGREMARETTVPMAPSLQSSRRYIERWVPANNAEVWSVNPATEAVTGPGGVMYSGRVQIATTRPTSCGG